jgi:O-antigen/teichoic acid export membrane protein
VVTSTQIAEQFDTEATEPPEVRGRSLKGLLARGGATLGAATFLERGFGFLANLLAARAAGPHSFGAYSIVLSTAGTVASYAGANIGSTATRFSGQFPAGSKGYRTFFRTLILVSLGSAALGMLVMFAGAGPFARVLLRNEGLVSVLRVAALSAGALILLECCRGLLVGQQRFQGLLVLSVVSGVGMLLILPAAAHIGAWAMIGGHAVVAILAVAACVLMARQLGIIPTAGGGDATAGPNARTIVTFGMVQLSAIIGLNIATTWLAALIARSDTSLLQMGVYAVANQFRGLASIVPGMLAQLTYPLLTAESGRNYGGPDRVLLVNTFLSTSLAVGFAGAIVVFLPWILPYLYGQSYTGAVVPSALLLATAVCHMGGTAAANRLSIVNLRALGIINTMWAMLIILLGIWLVPFAGATGAAAAFLIAHLASALAVLAVLRSSSALPQGVLGLSLTGIAAAAVFAYLAYLRSTHPLQQTALMCALLGALMVFMFTLLQFGWRQGWLPKLTRVAK